MYSWVTWIRILGAKHHTQIREDCFLVIGYPIRDDFGLTASNLGLQHHIEHAVLMLGMGASTLGFRRQIGLPALTLGLCRRWRACQVIIRFTMSTLGLLRKNFCASVSAWACSGSEATT